MTKQANKAGLLKWVEGKILLGELQNRFYPVLRFQDNMFVLTPCVEISISLPRPLRLAFLDIDGAYDNNNRHLLWDILAQAGVDTEWVLLLTKIDEDSQAQIT